MPLEFCEFNFYHSHAALKINWSINRSIDRYDTDPGGQATYHDGYKIVFSVWRKWIEEVATGGVL